ncbi:MAG: hypothetical protein KF782_24125 [Labilithrix sp.]|nr:hypothetical protein [Labilithrix sp.]
MSVVGEERFRELLDPGGVLRIGALASPERSAGYTVFAQRSDAALDVAALKAHAARFFDTKLGLTVDKAYRDAPPTTDAARIVLASDDGAASGTRLCFARPTAPADHAAAEAAERAQATHGMALLAHRCPTVWLVVRESDDDRVALTLAAILASALLGPILSPDGDELFGVRTARMKLEGRARPYR